MAVRLIAYSDYLCPWCYNASVRLRSLAEAHPDEVEIEYRSFLLRPEPGRRDLEAFRAYTRSWEKPAAEPDAGTFRSWTADTGPPSHSVPPHLVAKAAARQGDDAFARIHEGLLHAYFAENRDVTDCEVLRAIWIGAGLEPKAFEEHEDPALLDRVWQEHRDAVDAGVSGVPTLCMEGRDGFLTGAYPLEIYGRWVQRALDGLI